MRVSKLVALAGALAAAWLARSARASELSWEGAPDCPDRGQLLFELERALGKPLSEAGALTFHVTVESADARVTARVHVKEARAAGAADERVLVAASCSELADTLAVAISLAIGRSESDAEPEAPLVSRAAPLETPQPAAAASVDGGSAEAGASNEPGSGPRPSAFALMLADVGSLPHPALGAGLGLELSWARLRVQLGAAMFFPQRAEWVGNSDVGADLGLTLGTTRVCTPIGSPSASLSVPLCLGLELGRMEGVGHGVAAARSREVLWIAPRAEVGLSWALPDTRLSLETSLVAALPLNRDEFVFDGMGTIHQPSRVAGRLGASLNLAFE